jgi:hypothetical protein
VSRCGPSINQGADAKRGAFFLFENGQGGNPRRLRISAVKQRPSNFLKDGHARYPLVFSFPKDLKLLADGADGMFDFP